MADKNLLIITGLSGAGKSTALAALEDLDYFSVDGLPVALSPDLAAMMDRAAMRRFSGMALGMDLRDGDFLKDFEEASRKVSISGINARLIFLEASDADLFRRYQFTRRPHPLERQGMSLGQAIATERERLAPLRRQADIILDSTGFSVHDMRRSVQRLVRSDPKKRAPRINILSFGYKHGIPRDADMVFDMRSLPNPYFVEDLRQKSGMDAAVTEYIFSFEQAREMKANLLDYLRFTLRLMEVDERERVTVAIGCTGGRHRSVAIASGVAQELGKDYEVTLEHRHMDADRKAEGGML